MDVANLFIIAITAILVNNIVLSKFLGLCPFLGVSKQLDSAVGMGMAVIFVMTMASAITQLIYNYLLIPLNLAWLETIAFIIVIASFVQLVEIVIQRVSPPLYETLGIFLPLITTNCAILGIAEINTMQEGYTFIQSIVSGFATGIGFTLALVLMAGIREKLEYAEVPKSLQGLPIAFIVAGLMSLAFLGFSGLSF